MFDLVDALRKASTTNLYSSREFMRFLAEVRGMHAYKSSPYYTVRDMVEELVANEWVKFDQGPDRVRLDLPQSSGTELLVRAG